jgi:hypothetical protein
MQTAYCVFLYLTADSVNSGNSSNYEFAVKPNSYGKKSKEVPLHAMEALRGRGGIAPTHS